MSETIQKNIEILLMDGDLVFKVRESLIKRILLNVEILATNCRALAQMTA